MSEETFYRNVRKIKRYGWKPGLPDFRAYYYSPTLSFGQPALVDLRPQCPPVYDQGNLGSCTANAIGALVEFSRMKEGHHAFTPSRLFIYYNERVMEGTVNEDSGASISDGMKVVNKLGAPHESLWWYNVVKFTVKPNKNVYMDGTKCKLTQYMKVDNTQLNNMKACLAEGYPIVGGFTVYESFESQQVANTGIVPMPKVNEQIVGGHAILVVGYDDTKGWFIVRNSWGVDWGINGYFYIPYGYFTNENLADDFWTGRYVI